MAPHRRQMQWISLLLALPATLAYTLAHTARSATSQCTFTLTKAQCRAFRTQTPYMDDSRGFSTSNAVEEASLYVGGMDSFEMSDRYLTHGCQWYVDPTNPGSNRFLYNDENADVPKFNNERDTVNTECNDPGLWCYPTYSHRVCGGNGLPPPSIPLSPPPPAPPHGHQSTPHPLPLPLHCQALHPSCPRRLSSSSPSSSSSLRLCSGRRPRSALTARCVRVSKWALISPSPSPLHNSRLRQALVIEGGKVLPSPASPSRKSMAAQPQVNKGPAVGLPSAAGTVALWSSTIGRLAFLAMR